MRSMLIRCFGMLVFAGCASLALLPSGCSKKSDSGSTSNESASDNNGTSRKPRWANDVEYAGLRAKDRNNLRVIGLLMHEHANAKGGALPPAAICDSNGKPLLSWRVAMLPYGDETTLYKEFKLDEPWDSEHNKKLIPKMPVTYLLPGSGSEKDGFTHYRVFVAPMNVQGNRPMFVKPGSPVGGKLQNRYLLYNLPDGTSNTIMVAEAEEAVIWTKPDELDYDDKQPLPKLGYFWKDSTTVLMGDGSSRGISSKVDEKTLRLAITADDNMPLPSDF